MNTAFTAAPLKKIAALTMARNDAFFLERWMAYYARELGAAHVYVFLDGEDQAIPPHPEGVHIRHLPHTPRRRAAGDKTRIRFLSETARQLFADYDLVIGTDADEFLAVDPRVGQSLHAYLSGLGIRDSVSALGVDVGHNLREEGTLNPQQPFLAQRRFAVLSSRYTKPVVLSRPLQWGSGFHRVKGKNFHIDPHLVLFHCGYCDLEAARQKRGGSAGVDEDWRRHLARRAKVIQWVTDRSARDGDAAMKEARRLQQWLRPPFAWNKPSMLWLKPVIRIPERFRQTGI